MLKLNSFAKLNLYLSVRSRRPDNFHNLTTIFERIDLADTLILKSRSDRKIKIITNARRLPKDKSNLCWRAAKLLQERLKIKKGVEIKIIKRIPIGSGMGGGSSNAASVLLGLNRLWKLGMSKSKLARLGAHIGSDVPFFIYACPFALGQAKGDKIKPLQELKRLRLWQIVIVPRFSVSTPLIYKKWDTWKEKKGQAKMLTRPKYSANITLSALRKNDLSGLRKVLFNSLEPITTLLYPEVARIKAKLSKLGAPTILMSGSGPAVFALVSSRKEAVSFVRQLKREELSWQVFCSRTV